MVAKVHSMSDRQLSGCQLADILVKVVGGDLFGRQFGAGAMDCDGSTLATSSAGRRLSFGKLRTERLVALRSLAVLLNVWI